VWLLLGCFGAQSAEVPIGSVHGVLMLQALENFCYVILWSTALDGVGNIDEMGTSGIKTSTSSSLGINKR